MKYLRRVQINELAQRGLDEGLPQAEGVEFKAQYSYGLGSIFNLF